MSSKQTIILIFSKGLKDRQVKTRLSSLLSSTERQSLHRAFLMDTLSKSIGFEGAEVEIYFTSDPPRDHNFGVPWKLQSGVDLGERMANAFVAELQRYPRVIIIGTDSPQFPPSAFSDAVEALENYDLCIGPSEDGGYYLIGARKIDPAIFQNIAWGSIDVLADTVRNAAAAGYSVQLIDPAFDVDLPEDVARLQGSLAVMPEDSLPYIYIRKWFADFRKSKKKTRKKKVG